MQNYQKLYTIMFNAATNALRQIKEEDYAAAREILETAQRQTENMYMAQEEARTRKAPSEFRRGRAQAGASSFCYLLQIGRQAAFFI